MNGIGQILFNGAVAVVAIAALALVSYAHYTMFVMVAHRLSTIPLELKGRSGGEKKIYWKGTETERTVGGFDRVLGDWMIVLWGILLLMFGLGIVTIEMGLVVETAR